MICLWHTHREQWCQRIPFSLKKGRITFWHHSPIQGTTSSPSVLCSDSRGMCSSGWNAMAQMLYLLHSSSASSRLCVYVYTKNTRGKNIIPSYWITPALFSHSWTSWHTVNSAESVSGHCNLLLLQHWHFTMNSITTAAETGKGFPGCFLTFSALSDHLG